MQLEDRDEGTGGIMTPEYRAQVRRLARLRESARLARLTAARIELVQAQRSEENAAGEVARRSAHGRGNGIGSGGSDENGNDNGNGADALPDPLIYPGLYAPSGFDMMSILIRVIQRPDPRIDIGAIDSACALLLCDLRAPDTPIVYCSEPFEVLTGYISGEIIGRNCRFLQSPDGNVERGVRRVHTDDQTVFELKTRICAEEETQTTILNYKKGGERFDNILTTIPIRWNSDDARYVVGFQADLKNCFVGPRVA